MPTKTALPIHESIPPKAAAILRRLEKVFLKEPRKLFMDEWLKEGAGTIMDYTGRTKALIPPCNAVGCIAGWLSESSAGKRVSKRIGTAWPREIAAGVLGVPGFLADRLFYVNQWPQRFQKELQRSGNGTPEYAQVVVDRMEDWIIYGH
jgi:hypothetical protein